MKIYLPALSLLALAISSYRISESGRIQVIKGCTYHWFTLIFWFFFIQSSANKTRN
jgi:hypothetical protein